MRIHNEFVGGNIHVIKQIGNDVYLRNELRDTIGDWFYWAFCVEGAEGQTLNFHFGYRRVGYWGPAVSHDLIHWHWLDSADGESFTYQFGADENRVYFAHHMLYHPDHFTAFAESHGLAVSELCKSPKKRSVPYLSIGEGERTILLTARHHACESTGSYVLEGVLEELLSSPIPNTRVLCIPFVDYDGVLDGDQGKSRIPHDHNRDYIAEPLYPETAAIMRLVEQYGCHFGADFHAPGHLGKQNDTIFVVRNMTEKLDCFDRFSELFAAEITPDAMDYKKENDYPPCTSWNQPSPNCAYTVNCRPECDLSFSLESAYFGTPENKISQECLVALGHCFAKAMKVYLS